MPCGPKYRCRYCGGNHYDAHCPDSRWRSNGEYGGRLKVRVIPPGVFGLDLKHDMDGWARSAGARGRRKRWQSQAAKRPKRWGYYGIKESQRPEAKP
jgi:hypothetical protein